MKYEQAIEQLNAITEGAINSHSIGVTIVKMNDGKKARIPNPAPDLETLCITEFAEPTEDERGAEDWMLIVIPQIIKSSNE
jgi:hypothetical protein